MSETFDLSRRGFEESFFAAENDRLLRQMIEADRLRSQKVKLSAASGIVDGALLDQLMALEVRADTLTALTLAPLVLVAWADDDLDAKERAAILKAAERYVPADSPAHRLLAGWLQRKPPASIFDTWSAYVAALGAQLSAAERDALRSQLIGQARAVAEAAGGLLGLGWAVSPAEGAMLKRLEAAFPA
jgi:hypothetical protein